MENWLSAPLPSLLETAATVFVIYLVVVLFVRIAGLRTFAKMSSFGFASTVAIGSILATVVLNNDISLLKGAVALGTIMTFQQIFSGLKYRFKAFEKFTENSPMLLMDGTEFLEDNMKKAGVSHSDIAAKLREANVTQLSQIKAVVFETTGDVSVLHGSSDEPLPQLLMNDVTR